MTGKWCRVGTAGSNWDPCAWIAAIPGCQVKRWPFVCDGDYTSGHSPVVSGGNARVFTQPQDKPNPWGGLSRFAQLSNYIFGFETGMLAHSRLTGSSDS